MAAVNQFHFFISFIIIILNKLELLRPEFDINILLNMVLFAPSKLIVFYLNLSLFKFYLFNRVQNKCVFFISHVIGRKQVSTHKTLIIRVPTICLIELHAIKGLNTNAILINYEALCNAARVKVQ